jgi:hypothetical protein
MYEVYNAAAEAHDKTRASYLGMSEIGGECDRALWYSFRGFPAAPFDGRVVMLFRFGDHIEQDIIHWLRQAGYRIDGQQDSFEDHDGLFRGHCDGIVYGVTDQPHILEVKSCNKRSFESFVRHGVQKTQPKYYAQCQCYMGYAGLERALVAVQCKDDSALYFERIYFVRSDFEALRQRAYTIITANIAPAQMDSGSTACQWCRYRGCCWSPEETLVDKQTCGTCRYFGFQGLVRLCRHPDHVVVIRQWGVGCPQWVLTTAKDPHPDPVPMNLIVKAVAL